MELNPSKYQNQKQFIKDTDKVLRELFKGEIKGNFLIKIYHEVSNKLGVNGLIKYYPLTLTMENSITGNTSNPEFEICKHIVGLHKSNMIFVSDEERIKKQNDIKYQNQLVNEVVDQIKLNKYGASFFRKRQIFDGDRFLYFHVPYDLFVMCTRINEILTQESNKNVNFYSFYAKISNVGLSALSLLEDNFLDNTYPICRNIIELYVEFIVLLSCPSAIEKYNYLSSVEFGKSSCGQEYPEKFLDLYKNRINKKETRKNMFLHFGWVDNIPNYHKIVKNNPYSINGLITFLESVDQSYENYGIFYRRCHSYTHANVVGIKYPLLSYFEICIMLYMTIFNTYTVLCEKLKIDSKINDIDIVSKIEKDIKLLESQYMKMSTKNFENYHKNTIN